MTGKQMEFLVYEDAVDAMIPVGGVEGVLEHIKSYLEEMEDGDAHEFKVVRKDMTPEEIAALPEV